MRGQLANTPDGSTGLGNLCIICVDRPDPSPQSSAPGTLQISSTVQADTCRERGGGDTTLVSLRQNRYEMRIRHEARCEIPALVSTTLASAVENRHERHPTPDQEVASWKEAR
jgi:hypothetical protein